MSSVEDFRLAGVDGVTEFQPLPGSPFAHSSIASLLEVPPDGLTKVFSPALAT